MDNPLAEQMDSRRVVKLAGLKAVVPAAWMDVELAV
jgi:hypothetical protein